MENSLEETMQLSVLFNELEHVVARHVDRLSIRQNFCRVFSRAASEGFCLLQTDRASLEKLLSHFFSPGEAGILEEMLLDEKRRLYLEKRAGEEMILCAEHGIGMIPYGDSRYPAEMRCIDVPPPMLFYKGSLPEESRLRNSLCIIGTRTPEEVYAPATAFWAAGELARRDWINISGLALGCDTYGHLSSLQLGGLTGAILGNGLARTPHPCENVLLAERIVENGGFLLSESVPSAGATSTSLILRDRLQSALARGVFVIETDLGSGTMFTVDYALRMNKVVFVWDPAGSGVERNSVLTGNQVLLGRDPRPGWLFLPGSLKSDRIIPVMDGQELTCWLDGLNGKISRLKC